MNHHEVFLSFKCYSGKCNSGFVINFLGAVTRREYLYCFSADKSIPLSSKEEVMYTEYPAYSEGYFEWISILQSVIQAKNKFTMFELGAGFGPHLVNACIAAPCYHGKHFPYNLVGVEAEPTHFEWMKQNFIDNNIDPTKHQLINAAVFEKDGSIYFQVGFPTYYGNQIIYRALNFRNFIKEALFFFMPHRRNRIVSREITVTDYLTGKKETGIIRNEKVKVLSLSTLLRPFDYVDLIHADIQGAEARVFKSAQRDIHKKVKRIHIGTHGSQIEDELRTLFNNLGWKCLYDYPNGQKCDTPYGTINFQDGVQVWFNQELRPL